MSDDGNNVRVAVRVRPFIGIERAIDCQSVVSYPAPNQIQIGGFTNSSSGRHEHTFTYDQLYTEQSTQAEVYQKSVAPLVASFFEGYHATILAYGQTGSGKTHTMGTSSSLDIPKSEQGIIPRVVHELFEMMKAREQTHTYLLSLSFLEIYNDDIFDLLSPIPRTRADRPIPQIKEGRSGGIEVENIVKHEVKNVEETMDTLDRGSQNRAVGSTNMNATSSRSHAIFTLTLAQKVIEKDEMGVSNDEFITSKFHFVDLAGSERIKRTGAVGQRMIEGININQGLLALGNVISALASHAPFVPFRDSKITRLLQDSLGGNSLTLMIANISPADSNKDESLSTLQYANRAKNIKNQAVINRDPMSIKLEILRNRIRELEMELAIYQSGQIPTQEQRAAIKAEIAKNSVGGGVANLPGGNGVPGSTTTALNGLSPLRPSTTGSLLHTSASSSLSAFIPAPLLPAPHQMIIETRSWADLHHSLEQHEHHIKRLMEKIKRFHLDLNLKNEERLSALNRVEMLKGKIEMIATKFPEVYAYLCEEKQQVEAERAEKKKQQKEAAAAALAATATTAAPPTSSPDDTTTTTTTTTTVVDGGEAKTAESSTSPAADATATAVPSAAPSADTTAIAAVEEEKDDEESEPSSDDLFGLFSLFSAGGSANPNNAQLELVSQQQTHLQKLSNKYLTLKEKLQAKEIKWKQQHESYEQEIRKLRMKLRSAKRSGGASDLYDEDEEEDAALIDEHAEGEEHAASAEDIQLTGVESDSNAGGTETRRREGRRLKHSSGGSSGNVTARTGSAGNAAAIISPTDSVSSSPPSVVSNGSAESSPDIASPLLDALTPSPTSSLSTTSSSATAAPTTTASTTSNGIIPLDELSDTDAAGTGSELEDDEANSIDEEDVQRLRTLSTLKEREHERTLSLLQQEERAVVSDINLKETFLRELEQEKYRSELQRELYVKQLTTLESSLELHVQRIAELQKLAESKPVTATNVNGGLNDAQVAELKSLREKYKQIQREHALQKQKLKDMDLLKKQHANDEARLKALQLEIEKSKALRVELAKKMDAQSQRHREWLEHKENSIRLIQKTARKNENDVRKWKQEVAQKELQLRRARETNTILSRKVRDQDASAQVRAAKQAAKAAGINPNGTRANRAGSVPMGIPMLRDGGSGNNTARGKKAASARRKGATPQVVPMSGAGADRKGSHSCAAGAVDSHLLSHPVHARAFQEDVRSLLREETYRLHLQHELQRLEEQQVSNAAQLQQAMDALEAEDPNRSTEEQNALEREVSIREEALAITRSSLNQKRQELDAFLQPANHSSPSSTTSPLSSMSEFEDRVAAKFRAVLSEPPKRLLTELLKAVLAMGVAPNAASNRSGAPNAEEELLGYDAPADPNSAGVASAGSTIDLGATFIPSAASRTSLAQELQQLQQQQQQQQHPSGASSSPPRPSSQNATPTRVGRHAKEHSVSGLAIAVPDRAALSTSPLQVGAARERSSMPPMVSPRSQQSQAAMRKSHGDLSAVYPQAQAAQPQGQMQGQMQGQSPFPMTIYGYSQLQPHLVAPHGIAKADHTRTLSFDEDGEELEDTLEPLPVSAEAMAQAASLSASLQPPPLPSYAPLIQPFSAGPTISHHAPNRVQHPQEPHSAGVTTLHNNYTDSPPDASTVGSGGSSSLSSSVPASGASSTSAAVSNKVRAKAQLLLFERLSNPALFTGSQKAKFESGDVAQNQAKAALLYSKGRAAAAAAAAASSGGASLPAGKKPLISSLVLPSSNSGAASNMSGSQSARPYGLLSTSLDRSPSPNTIAAGGTSSVSTEVEYSSTSSSLMSSQLAKLPFHERLSDPRTFTGAQKQKFADANVSGIQQAGSGGISGAKTARVPTHTQRPSYDAGSSEHVAASAGTRSHAPGSFNPSSRRSSNITVNAPAGTTVPAAAATTAHVVSSTPTPPPAVLSSSSSPPSAVFLSESVADDDSSSATNLSSSSSSSTASTGGGDKENQASSAQLNAATTGAPIAINLSASQKLRLQLQQQDINNQLNQNGATTLDASEELVTKPNQTNRVSEEVPSY